MNLFSFFPRIYTQIYEGKRAFWGQFLKMFLKKFLSIIWIAQKFLKVWTNLDQVSYRRVSYKRKRVYTIKPQGTWDGMYAVHVVVISTLFLYLNISSYMTQMVNSK